MRWMKMESKETRDRMQVETVVTREQREMMLHQKYFKVEKKKEGNNCIQRCNETRYTEVFKYKFKVLFIYSS